MNIVIGMMVLCLLSAWVWRRLGTDARRAEAYRGVGRMLVFNTPRVLVALIGASLFAELLPEEVVRRYLGDTSGFTGVLLEMGLGIVTPGGAFVSFALAAGAFQAGATAPAMMSYLTAWALLGLTKVMAEELALLGPRFILARFAVSLPGLLIVGGVALVLG